MLEKRVSKQENKSTKEVNDNTEKFYKNLYEMRNGENFKSLLKEANMPHLRNYDKEWHWWYKES